MERSNEAAAIPAWVPKPLQPQVCEIDLRSRLCWVLLPLKRTDEPLERRILRRQQDGVDYFLWPAVYYCGQDEFHQHLSLSPLQQREWALRLLESAQESSEFGHVLMARLLGFEESDSSLQWVEIHNQDGPNSGYYEIYDQLNYALTNLTQPNAYEPAGPHKDQLYLAFMQALDQTMAILQGTKATTAWFEKGLQQLQSVNPEINSDKDAQPKTLKSPPQIEVTEDPPMETTITASPKMHANPTAKQPSVPITPVPTRTQEAPKQDAGSSFTPSTLVTLTDSLVPVTPADSPEQQQPTDSTQPSSQPKAKTPTQTVENVSQDAPVTSPKQESETKQTSKDTKISSSATVVSMDSGKNANEPNSVERPTRPQVKPGTTFRAAIFELSMAGWEQVTQTDNTLLYIPPKDVLTDQHGLNEQQLIEYLYKEFAWKPMDKPDVVAQSPKKTKPSSKTTAPTRAGKRNRKARPNFLEDQPLPKTSKRSRRSKTTSPEEEDEFYQFNNLIHVLKQHGWNYGTPRRRENRLQTWVYERAGTKGEDGIYGQDYWFQEEELIEYCKSKNIKQLYSQESETNSEN